MNYLYTENILGNPVENAIILGNVIVLHHHSTVKIYSLSFDFIKSKYFYEKILNIERIDDNTFAILFKHGKLIVCNIDFHPISLRIVDGMENLSVYNNYVILYNQYKFKYFHTTDPEIKEFYLNFFNIYNIQKVFFMENYIPIILVISSSLQSSQCHAIGLDGKPIVIEQFNIIDNVMFAKSLDKFIIFANRNFIQLKYKRESYLIKLNKNLNSDDFLKIIEGNLLECTTDETHEANYIFLDNPHIFNKDDSIFILNGNGELFRFTFKFDIKKVYSVHIEFITKTSIPKSIDFKDNYFIISSWLQDTILFKFDDYTNKELFGNNYPISNTMEFLNASDSNIKNDELRNSNNINKNNFIENEAKNLKEDYLNNNLLNAENDNANLSSDIINSKYKTDNINLQYNSFENKMENINERVVKLTAETNDAESTKISKNDDLHQGKVLINDKLNKNLLDLSHSSMNDYNSIIYKTDKYDFKEIKKLKSIGMAKSIEQEYNHVIVTASKGVYRGKFQIDLEIIQKLKINEKIVDITENKSCIVVKTCDKMLYFNSSLEIIKSDDTIINYVEFMNYRLFYDNSKNLIICKNEENIISYSNVECWSVNAGKLCIISNNSFKCIEFINFEIIFESKKILLFENQIFNDLININSEIQLLNVLEIKKIESIKERIIETQMVENKGDFFFLFRTKKQLYIYKLFFGKLEKCFLSKQIIFETEKKALHNLNKLIYCESKNPCFIIFIEDLTILECNLRLDSPVLINDSIFSGYKENIVKIKFDLNSYLISNNMILKPQFKFKSKKGYKNQLENKTMENSKILNLQLDEKRENIFGNSEKLNVKRKSIDNDIVEAENNIKRYKHSDGLENYDLKLIKDTNLHLSKNSSELEHTQQNEPKSIAQNHFINNDSIIDNSLLLNLLEEHRYNTMIKKVICRKDCYVFITAKYVEFDYKPFIPIVHISDPQTGKTHSEPINKEEAEYINPYPKLNARTLKYKIELKSKDFKFISEIELEPCEFVCDAKFMFNDCLVICTSFPEGEDKMCKGKLLIYSLIDIVFDPENPHINKKLKFICCENFKDACLYATEIRSLIALCVGTKLMVYEFDINKGLDVSGINEISILSTGLYSTKNFITVSDLLNGIYFFFLRPKDPLKIHLLARSNPIPNCRFVTGIDYYCINKNKTYLSLIAIDKFGTFHIYTYSPDSKETDNLNFLIKRAEISTKTNFPIEHSFLYQHNSYEMRFITANVNISIKAINIPKILILQHFISSYISNTCGINPKNYLESIEFTNMECKSVISERILLEFFYFKPNIQDEICNLFGNDYYAISELIESCFIKK